MRKALLIAMFLCFVPTAWASTTHVDPRMSAAATKLAGRPVSVHCFSIADWNVLARQEFLATNGEVNLLPDGGLTYADRGEIDLSPDYCDAIARFTYRRWWPRALSQRAQLAEAVEVLAHEIQHAKGISDEATAECYGEQTTATVARALRSSVKPSTARTIALLAWRYTWPTKPASYRSAECRNGGALDLRPSSSVWP